MNSYEMFQFEFNEYFSNQIEDMNEEKEKRKDFCYDCSTDEGYWVMMALRCSKCNKILIGG